MKTLLSMGKTIFLMTLLMTFMNTKAFAQSKDEKAVADVVESLRKAMIIADKNELENLTLDELTYGHSHGNVQNKKEFIDGIVSGKSVFVSIALTYQTIKVVDKTAIVRHVLTAVTNDDGKPGAVTLHVLLVWLKQKGKWKLLARQAVRI